MKLPNISSMRLKKKYLVCPEKITQNLYSKVFNYDDVGYKQNEGAMKKKPAKRLSGTVAI